MDIITTLQTEFIPYAGEILTNNLPNVADGLLPVQRKVLWALYKNRVTSDKPFIKLLRASAMTMVYYVYGDMPLNTAMKNMANNGINYFYLEPKGSFGDKRKKEGVGASPRYIECKLSQYSEELLRGVNKNTIPFKRNFDNTEDEPIFLPSVIPNVLTNTSQSIAVGEASKIPSHNLNQLCDSLINYINEHDIDKAIDLIQCPDFIGGRIIYDRDVFREIYNTGKGSFTLLGSYTYDESENRISITEVPYGVYIEDIEDKLRTGYDKGVFKEIADIHDNSGVQGIELQVYLKKNTDIEQFIAKLRKYTPFESKFSCNFTLLDLDGKTPILMSLQNIYDKWIKHRINCIRNEISYDLQEYSKELNKLNALKIISVDEQTLIKVINLIRSSKSEKEAISKLQKEFDMNQEQLEYIATIKLININKEWISNKLTNIKKLEQKINELNTILKSPKKISNIIIESLNEVKKRFGIERKTKIVFDDNKVGIMTQEIENYNAMFYITNENYFKKIPLTSLRSAGEHKIKDGDFIIDEISGDNLSDILIFTNKAVCYKVKAYDLQDSKTSVLGDYLPNLLNLDKDEDVIKVTVTNNYEGYLLFAYENGKIAKINLSAYATKTNRSKLVNAYSLGSKLVNIIHIVDDIDILCQSSINKVLVCNTSNINPKNSKTSIGVQTLKSKNNSYMTVCTNIANIDGIADFEYYKGGINGIGCYLKKTDSLKLKN